MDPSMMQGGPPPDMMAQFAGGGGAPPEAPPLPSGADVTEIINQMLALADEYRQSEDEPAHLLVMEKLRTEMQKLLADEQKMQDDLMQGKASPQAMRRYAG